MKQLHVAVFNLNMYTTVKLTVTSPQIGDKFYLYFQHKTISYIKHMLQLVQIYYCSYLLRLLHMLQILPPPKKKKSKLTHTCTSHLNGHFSGKPELAGWPLDNLTVGFRVWSFKGQMPFLTATSRNTLGFTFLSSTMTHQGEGVSLPFAQLSNASALSQKNVSLIIINNNNCNGDINAKHFHIKSNDWWKQ